MSIDSKSEIQEDQIRLRNKKIILFDGICNFCDSFVHFVFSRLVEKSTN